MLTRPAIKLPVGAVSGYPGYPYVNNEARTYVLAMPVAPNDTRKGVIDNLFSALKTGATSGSNLLGGTKCDAFHLFAAHDAGVGIINAKNPGVGDAVLIDGGSGAPTFVTDRGRTTNGTNNYIQLLNPSTFGGGLGTNAGTFGVWITGDTASTAARCGQFDGTDGLTIAMRSTNSRVDYRFNQAAVRNGPTNSSLASNLFHCIARNSGQISAYVSGVAAESGVAVTATTVNNANLRLGSISASAFAAEQWAVCWIGGAFNATEHLDLYNAFAAYKTAVGF